MDKIVAVVVAGIVSFAVSSGAWAQGSTASQLVGVWQLVTDTNTPKDGAPKSGAAFGSDPKGMFIFTSDGHYSSINARSDLPKFISNNRLQGTPEENKAIVQGSIAHFGRYTLSPDGKTLLLKAEGGTWPAWIGTEQKRDLTINGDEMKYFVNASIGGVSELTYRRVK